MSHGMDNYYARLGISRDATQDEIRAAYREAARKFHPDTRKEKKGTELFLGIQQAYEILSDPKKRGAYDAALPKEENPSDVNIDIQYSRSALIRSEEPQLMYVMLDIKPPLELKSKPQAPPLNLGLVIDRSTSMKGSRMDIVKATVRQLLRELRPEDYLSIVIFSDRAEVIIPATRGSDYHRIDARVSMIQTGGGTEMFHGLEAGLGEISKNLKPGHLNQLILITDGRTYGDESACLGLAEQAKTNGVTISSLGIGGEWNDVFLDSLSGKTGGNCVYVTHPRDIKRFLEIKFSGFGQIYAENIRLEYDLGPEVQIRYAFRLKPDPGKLEMNSNILSIGNVKHKDDLQIVIEFLVSKTAEDVKRLLMLKGKLKMEIPSLKVPSIRMPISIFRDVKEDDFPEPPPPVIVQAMGKLTLYRMQEQARQDIAEGNIDQATQRLRHLATNLLSQGQSSLASAVMQEAGLLERGGNMSEDGAKQIKYGTRGLLLPTGMETRSWQ